MPWLAWPALAPSVSHRLTWVTCCALAGLAACAGPARALPADLVGVALLLAVQQLAHHAPMLQEGAYFAYFRETAWLADGLLVTLAVAWGGWALWQLPRAWWRSLRWVGAAWMLANAAAMGRQWPWGVMGQGSASGLLGLDRYLGASVVVWGPVLMAWSAWWGLALGPLLLGAGKATAWLAAFAAWLSWRGRPRGLEAALLGAGLLLAITWGTVGVWTTQCSHRLLTWLAALQASVPHPWLGHGWSPLAQQALVRTQAPLPSIHSDALALAFHGGWPLAILVGGVLWRTIRAPARTRESRALRASLVAACVMAAGSSVFGQARLLSGLVLLMLWKRVEDETDA